MEEDIFCFEHEREECLNSRMQRTQDYEAKGFRIEEKVMELETDKAVLERDERHQSTEERKDMLAV